MTDETVTDETESREWGTTGLGERLEAGRLAVVTDQFVHFVELAAAAVFHSCSPSASSTSRCRSSTPSGGGPSPTAGRHRVRRHRPAARRRGGHGTVVAYTRETDTRRIVRLVVYTGVVAAVRTAVFRTGEFPTAVDALFAALSYAVVIFGPVALLFVERLYG